MVSRATGRTASAIVLLLLGGILLAGCSEEELRPTEPEGGELFRSYVSLGNSITAGFQSGGINDSTQRASYANMVAEAMGTRFGLPLMAAPGCPPPLVNVFEGSRVAGGSDDTCGGRRTPAPPVLHNVAVPEAEVIDALTNLDPASSPNPLTTFILGGRTQIEAAREADPSFVSVWLGNNDVLQAALTGSTEGITPPPTFAGRYSQVADEIEEMGVEGAVLIGVGDVTLIPYLSPGAAYYSAAQQGALPPTFQVDESCRPGQLGEVTLVPFGYGFGELLARAAQGQQVELDCADDPEVLSRRESRRMQLFVNGYNAAIRQVALEKGWAFVDPNPLLRQLRQQGEIPLFPNTTGVAARERPFGELFSKDGVHPSRSLHRRIAELVVEAINQEYGTSLALPEE